MANPMFEIKNLHVNVDDKAILKGVDLTLEAGQTHAIMGLNGSGKTTLAYTLMGHPRYEVIQGEVRFMGQSLLEMSPDERAKLGLFLGFQYPVGIPGVSVANLLRASLRAVHGEKMSARDIRAKIKAEIKTLNIPDAFMNRSINEGFSGGEKKRLETLQMKLLEPKVAVLDETDSGLDIDALKNVSAAIESMRAPERSFLLITHYKRLLEYVRPDRVHVFIDGRVVASGGMEIADRLESDGYQAWESELAQQNQVPATGATL